ncbi:MAG: hypothetical protein LBP64_05900 [Tannerella sp.]|jgi:hypothetical protein|nr:hypothetical protein [Tannerella sp.]
MKNKVLYTTAMMCLVLVGISLKAQVSGRQRFDKREFITRHNAFITAEIGLTSDEAVEFIPIENQMKEKLFETGNECRKMNRDIRSRQSVSDETFLKLIDCNLETRSKELQIEKEYYEKFKKILSPEKLYKYQQAEFKFMREFMSQGDRQRPPRNGNTHKKDNEVDEN